ncbi:MAG: hypothetical protein HY929_08370 [Euryarchaeota archaeon]|nr:hypothetical protein [Euryarchaeota archaeon]
MPEEISIDIAPGQTLTYTLAVENVGSVKDEIEISWDISQVHEAWGAKIYDKTAEKIPPFDILLDSREIYYLTIKVTAPIQALGGDQTPIIVNGKSKGDPSKESSLKIIFKVKSIEDADVISFDISDARVGEDLNFSVTVKNTGTVLLSDSKLHIRITSSKGKEFWISEDVQLPPRETKTYLLKCEIPEIWTSGTGFVTVGVANSKGKWLSILSPKAIVLSPPLIHGVHLYLSK